MRLRSVILVAGGMRVIGQITALACVALLGCAARELDSTAVPSVALDSHDRWLFVAQRERLWALPVTHTGLHSDAVALEQPCARQLDLAVWGMYLFVLCSDGAVFRSQPLPDARDADDAKARVSPQLHAEDWEQVRAPDPRTQAVALQRSDGGLFMGSSDGTLTAVHVRFDPATYALDHLDRFRGPDRGGRDQLPLADQFSFEFYPSRNEAAFALGLARGPELLFVTNDFGSVHCSVSARGARIVDLSHAGYAQGVAAVLLDRRQRPSLIYIKRNRGWWHASAGVSDLHGRRRLAPLLRCED